MTMLLVALLIGMVIGYLDVVPESFYKIADKIMFGILFVLLFTLAVGIGSDEVIFSNLGTVGIKGFMLAVGSVAGSIGLLWVVQKKLFGGDLS